MLAILQSNQRQKLSLLHFNSNRKCIIQSESDQRQNRNHLTSPNSQVLQLAQSHCPQVYVQC